MYKLCTAYTAAKNSIFFIHLLYIHQIYNAWSKYIHKCIVEYSLSPRGHAIHSGNLTTISKAIDEYGVDAIYLSL